MIVYVYVIVGIVVVVVVGVDGIEYCMFLSEGSVVVSLDVVEVIVV